MDQSVVQLGLAPGATSEVPIRVTEEVDKASKASKTLLAGRVVPDRYFSMQVVRGMLKSLWKCDGEFTLFEKGFNTFVITFQLEEDRRYIIEEGPWIITGQLFAVMEWPVWLTWEQINKNETLIWVQLHGLSLPQLTRENAIRFAEQFEDLRYIDGTLDDPTRVFGFLRIRVPLQLDKPIICGKSIENDNGCSSWVSYQYEKIVDHCFKCFKLGHIASRCGMRNQTKLIRGANEDGKTRTPNVKAEFFPPPPSKGYKAFYEEEWDKGMELAEQTQAKEIAEISKANLEKPATSKPQLRWVIKKKTGNLVESGYEGQSSKLQDLLKPAATDFKGNGVEGNTSEAGMELNTLKLTNLDIVVEQQDLEREKKRKIGIDGKEGTPSKRIKLTDASWYEVDRPEAANNANQVPLPNKTPQNSLMEDENNSGSLRTRLKAMARRTSVLIQEASPSLVQNLAMKFPEGDQQGQEGLPSSVPDPGSEQGGEERAARPPRRK